MEYLLNLLWAIVFCLGGAALNRIRGGLEFPKVGELPLNKLWQPLVYAVAVAAFCPYGSINLWLFLLWQFACMYLGQQICGWGTYIGELTTGNKSSREECEVIDDLIKNISSPRVYGFCGLSLRGFLWTFLLGLPLYNIWLMLSGLLMGTAYLAATLICQLNGTATGKRPWNLGEWIWGGFLWLSIYLTVLS